MLILGVVLILLGYFLAIPVLVTIGVVVAVVGAVLLLVALVAPTREIGGRRYWY